MRKQSSSCLTAMLALTLLAAAGCLINPRRAYQALSKRIVKVPTVGMEPTIKLGSYAVVDADYYKDHPIARYDMVMFENPNESGGPDATGTFYVKRIIAFGGETVQVRGGSTFINGQQLKEPFQFHPDPEKNCGPLVVPEGEYFLLGDNRPNSFDSRYWKKPTLEKKYIGGKVIEIITE